METTLARCAMLQERTRGLERALGLPWTPPVEIVAETYDEACEPASRCTVSIELVHDACDVDIICPTLERRGHASECIGVERSIVAHIPGVLDLDGARGTARLTGEDGGNIDVEITEWR